MQPCFSYLNVNVASLNTHVEMWGQDFVSIVSLEGTGCMVSHHRHPCSGIFLLLAGSVCDERLFFLMIKLKKWSGEQQTQHLHPSHFPFPGWRDWCNICRSPRTKISGEKKHRRRISRMNFIRHFLWGFNVVDLAVEWSQSASPGWSERAFESNLSHRLIF